MNHQKFIVLGGGFAGVEAAIKLRKYNYEVTLVSDRDYLFVYPVSIWIPTRKKKFKDVTIPLDKLAGEHGFKLVVERVKKIEHQLNQVRLEDQILDYDFLFVAIGMQKVISRGLEFTHSICGQPEEAVKIADELDKLVEKGRGRIAVGFGGNPKDPSAVRGGPAFELLFNISHFLKQKKVREQFELNFFAPMKQPGKRMGRKALKKLDVFFKHYKVKKWVGQKIIRFEQNAVVFEDETRLESDLIIFISGGAGHRVIQESGLPVNDAGFVKIDQNCKVEGHMNIYAIGDVAEITGAEWAAKQGHVAEIMADVSAFNVHSELSGSDKRKNYQEKLNIICVMDSGDGAAIVMRDHKKEIMLPLPVIGHWLKKAWGFYYRNSKLRRIPRIPGM
jgi:sulfide:quinone oxidoreductase